MTSPYQVFENGRAFAQNHWTELSDKEKRRELSCFLKTGILPLKKAHVGVWREVMIAAHDPIEEESEICLDGMLFGFYVAVEEYQRMIGKTERNS